MVELIYNGGVRPLLASSRWAFACLTGMALLACGREAEPALISSASQDSLARGTELMAQGQPREATEVLQSALEIDPTSSAARLALAGAEVKQGDLSAAQRHLEEVLGLAAQRDDLVQALSGLADIRHQLGDEQGARDDRAQAEALRASPLPAGPTVAETVEHETLPDPSQETRPIAR
jgi:Flp pilus assembly protein TadD